MVMWVMLSLKMVVCPHFLCDVALCQFDSAGQSSPLFS